MNTIGPRRLCAVASFLAVWACGCGTYGTYGNVVRGTDGQVYRGDGMKNLKIGAITSAAGCRSSTDNN